MTTNPGNKTDQMDLHAQHRAAVAGFGLSEPEKESPCRELQLRARYRLNLVEQAASIACQVREHLQLAMPGYAAFFDHLLDQQSAMAISFPRYWLDYKQESKTSANKGIAPELL